MIISEKQITQLLQVAQSYISLLNTIQNYEKSLLSECGKHNQIHIARLLQTIAEQQSDKLIEVKDDNN